MGNSWILGRGGSAFAVVLAVGFGASILAGLKKRAVTSISTNLPAARGALLANVSWSGFRATEFFQPCFILTTLAGAILLLLAGNTGMSWRATGSIFDRRFQDRCS